MLVDEGVYPYRVCPVLPALPLLVHSLWWRGAPEQVKGDALGRSVGPGGGGPSARRMAPAGPGPLGG